MPWRDGVAAGISAVEPDEEYYRFSVRFLRLYEEACDADSSVTVKSLDGYLLWVADTV